MSDRRIILHSVDSFLSEPLCFLHGISCRVPWGAVIAMRVLFFLCLVDAFASHFAILCLHICHPHCALNSLNVNERA